MMKVDKATPMYPWLKEETMKQTQQMTTTMKILLSSKQRGYDLRSKHASILLPRHMKLSSRRILPGSTCQKFTLSNGERSQNSLTRGIGVKHLQFTRIIATL